MELWEQIITEFPELSAESDLRALGIVLRDDSDGKGAYIEKWTYEKPMPSKFKLGKA